MDLYLRSLEEYLVPSLFFGTVGMILMGVFFFIGLMLLIFTYRKRD